MSWKQYTLIGLGVVVLLAGSGVVYMTTHAVQQYYAEKGVAGAYLAARHAAKNHAPDVAGDFYQQVLWARPQDMSILQATMQAKLLAGDMHEARDSAVRVLDVLPDNRQALLLLAISAFEEEQYGDAGVYLDAMPRGPMSQLLEPNIRLWVGLAQGDKDIEKRSLAQLARASSFVSVSLSQAAHALELAGDFEHAAAHYQRAAQSGGLRYLFFAKSYGGFLERQGKVEEARKVYQFYQNTHFTDPYIEAAEARLQTGDTAPLETSERVNLADAFLAIGEVMMDEKRVDLAIAYTQLALFLDPENDQTSYQLGQLTGVQENWSAAAHHFGRITFDDLLHPEAQIQRAQMFLEMGEVETAITLLTTQVAGLPEHQASWAALGDLYRVQKQFEQAHVAYGRAIDTLSVESRDDWHLYFARGITRERLGNWREAEMDLQRARRLSNDEPHVLNYLGYSWIDQGIHLDEGLKIIRQAVSKMPQNGSFVDSLGWALFKLGRYDEALEVLQKAGELEPVDPVVTDHLGDTLWRLGRQFEARYQWRKALAFEPEDSDRANIEQKLLLGLGPVPKAKPEAYMPRGGTAI
ncbi:tetratricopeptide repeat protein [Alphaproteobacteria bacterium]|nr:tetratricopeptide repeat protein [Alphaproteobacteria bacterium]